MLLFSFSIEVSNHDPSGAPGGHGTSGVGFGPGTPGGKGTIGFGLGALNEAPFSGALGGKGKSGVGFGAANDAPFGGALGGKGTFGVGFGAAASAAFKSGGQIPATSCLTVLTSTLFLITT